MLILFRLSPKNHRIHNGIALRSLLTILLFFVAQVIFSQNTLDKAGLSSSAPASVAYGIRLLSNSYAGPALQVRRSSDNATQDIGFTVGGNLDTASLKSFVGINDGLVTTWYDQSGNGKNLTQATAAYQPSLVMAGIINREKGLPFIRFFGIAGGNQNSLNLAADMTTVGHISAVHRFTAGGDGFILGHSGSYDWHSDPGTSLLNNSYTSASIKGGAAWSNGLSYSPTSMPWPTSLTINEIAPASPTVSTIWNNIGSDRVFHHITGGGGYSELMLFPAMLSTTNRKALEGNQGTYFSIGTTILPVTWLNFTTELQKEHILLTWQTASEEDSRDFIVQHSSNGDSWTNLATLSAGTNSNSIRSYTYRHQSPLSGSNFYRILQTDLNGKSSYSPVRKVLFTAEHTSFSILANPIVNGLLSVQVNNAMTLFLYNADGRLLWTKQLSAGKQSMPVTNYPKGMYLLKGNNVVKSFLVQ